MKVSAAFLLLIMATSAFAAQPSCELVDAIQYNDRSAVAQLIAAEDVGVDRFCRGITPLIAAIDSENVEAVKKIIERGADLNLQESGNLNSPLMHAIHSSLEILELLLDKGADLDLRNSEGNNAFNMAIKTRNVLVASLFIDHGAIIDDPIYSTGKTPLMEAAYHGDVDMLKALLQAGADVNKRTKLGRSAYEYALQSKNAEIVQLLLPHTGDDLEMTLLSAMTERRVDIVKQLLESVPDVDSKIKNLGLLALSIRLEEFEFAKYLIQRGINLEIPHEGSSPLFLAANRGQLDLVEMIVDSLPEKVVIDSEILTKVVESENLELLKKLTEKSVLTEEKILLDKTLVFKNLEIADQLLNSGIKIDLDSSGKTAPGDSYLLKAYEQKKMDLVYSMISAGADINFVDPSGMTLLMYASQKGEESFAMELLKRGARKDLVNSDNRTASELAFEAGFTEISETISAFAEDTVDGF